MILRKFRYNYAIRVISGIEFSFATQGLFSRPKTSTSSIKSDSLEELKKLLPRLKEKKLDSSVFLEASKTLFENISKEVESKQTNEGKRKDIILSEYILTLCKSIRYLRNKSALEVISIFLKNENIDHMQKEALDELIDSLNDLLFRAEYSDIEYEIIYSSLYTILQKSAAKNSLNLFSDLIRSCNYHEQFDQRDIETLSRYFADDTQRQILINRHFFASKKLANLLKTAMKKHPSLSLVRIATENKIFLEEIYKYSEKIVNTSFISSPELTLNMPIVYLIQTSSAQNSPQFWLVHSSSIESNTNIPLAARIEFLYKAHQIGSYKKKEKPKKVSRKIANPEILEFENLIKSLVSTSDPSLLRTYDVVSLLNTMCRCPNLTNSSKALITQFIVKGLNLEPKILTEMSFMDLLLMLVYIQTYRQNSSINFIIIQAVKLLEPQISNMPDLLYTLNILLNFRIIPKELIQLLPRYDTKDRRKLDSVQTIYYISTFCNLFEITHQFNSISHAGLQHIEDILYNNHKSLSIEEKCIMFMKMKYISSLNKSLYIAKFLLENKKNIPQKYFAATVNNLYNYNYLQIDHQSFLEEIKLRLPQCDHQDLVFIGKALMWHAQGDDTFWIEYFIKMDQLFKKHFIEYTSWVCDLYQIIYTIELKNPNLMKKIQSITDDIDFDRIKSLYFERPSMPTSEEITKSEFEIEDILITLGAKYERQKIVGIHKADFLINSKTVVEIYGRHHYAEKNIINGATLWRENQLKAIGLEVKAINLQEWNSLGTMEKRIGLMKKLMYEPSK